MSSFIFLILKQLISLSPQKKCIVLKFLALTLYIQGSKCKNVLKVVKYINIVLSLDAKPVKLPDEIMLLDLACVWTGHGKQVLVAVVVIFFIVAGDVIVVTTGIKPRA